MVAGGIESSQVNSDNSKLREELDAARRQNERLKKRLNALSSSDGSSSINYIAYAVGIAIGFAIGHYTATYNYKLADGAESSEVGEVEDLVDTSEVGEVEDLVDTSE